MHDRKKKDHFSESQKMRSDKGNQVAFSKPVSVTVVTHISAR